jgi:uncharacterized protein YbjT (DUF2867 family)/ketosteroid isomerase-like protein
MTSEIHSFSALLRTPLGSRLDPSADTFLDMVADDAVMEFPYAPPGVVTRLAGREAIAEHLDNLGGMIEFDRMGAPVTHETNDPDVIVLEFEGHGRGVVTGEAYDQQYISVIRLRDGRIVHYRDYWNPLVVLRALKGAAHRTPSSEETPIMVERVLVTGGTGKTGRLVAQQLAERGIEPLVASRRPKDRDQVRFDWSDPSSFAPALDRADAVYLVAPTDRTDHLETMRPMLELAVQRVPGRLVLLSASSLERGGPLMGQVHGWLDDHAARWSALRPSWFMQNFITERLPAILSEGCITSATGEGRIPFIDAADIAAVAVQLLTDPELDSGEHILTGPEALSYDQAAAMISQATGRPVSHRRLSTTELAKFYVGMGLPKSYAPLLAQMEEAIARGSEDRVTDEVARLTGRAPRTLRAFLEAHRGAFLPC